ncbi:MAG: GNAT family N-acetyltransferase [Oscillospiraceae bacterium]|nr:GNAT family N-acetyltransferase [Oscillospiraceae bacterium]MDD4414440.1 GNAT family N-acetyltransferase [Oscillospiraceae bacterium]
MPLMFAGMDMAPSLRKIWLDAFPEDGPEDVEFFFSHALNSESCAVWVEDGQPVSMTFLLPSELVFSNGSCLNLRYIYAAGTLTAFRGRGIFSNLLTEVHELLRCRGVDACFLRPAQPGLFNFYSRFGYKPYFYNTTENIEAETEFISSGVEKNISSAAFDKIPQKKATFRNGLLKEHPVWVRWPDRLLDLAVLQAEKFGGATIADKNIFALCEKMGDKVWIREWLCRPGYEAALGRAVAEHFTVSSFELRRPARHDDIHSSSFGMIYPLNDKADNLIEEYKNKLPYMGLAFD